MSRPRSTVLLQHIRKLVPENDALRVMGGSQLRGIRVIEILERMGSREARKLLDTLSRGAPGARLTEEAKAALARLAGR